MPPPYPTIAFGVDTFVAVGASSTVLASVDGSVWTSGWSYAYGNLASITYGGGLFVLIDSYDEIEVSSDGYNWYYENYISGSASSITYGNGLYVAVGTDSSDSSTCAIWTSTDGSAWTEMNTAATYSDLEAITYGNDTFVAVGGDATIVTSLDGIFWEVRTVADDYNNLTGVAFGNGVFVAVGNYGVLTSPDAVTWSAVSSGYDYDLQAVAFGNGTFVAIGQDGEIETSTSGAAWTPQTLSVPYYFDYNLTGITFGNGTFVAVGTAKNEDTGATVIVTLTSPNGISWSVSNPGSPQLSGVAFTNGAFVAVGNSGTILTSTNGQA